MKQMRDLKAWQILLQKLKDEQGQAIAEVTIVLPVFLVTLFLSCAFLFFIAEAARIERVANELVRELYQVEGSPSQAKLNEIVDKSLARLQTTRYRYGLVVYKSPTTQIANRCRVELRLEYRPFSNRYLRNSNIFNPVLIKKLKKFHTAGWIAGEVL